MSQVESLEINVFQIPLDGETSLMSQEDWRNIDPENRTVHTHAKTHTKIIFFL